MVSVYNSKCFGHVDLLTNTSKMWSVMLVASTILHQLSSPNHNSKLYEITANQVPQAHTSKTPVSLARVYRNTHKIAYLYNVI